MTKKNFGAHESIARAAAVEYAETAKVGAFIEAVDEGDNSVTYLFASSIKGYQGWRWSVTLFEQDAANPTVSEVVLLPGEESILAPAWVPWSERLADWKALQVELEAQAALEAAELAEAEDESAEDDADATDKWDDTDDSEDAGESEDAGDSVEENDADADSEPHDETKNDSTDEAGEGELAAANLEEGENAEGETKDAGKRPPRFGRRNRRWGQKKNRKGDSPAE